MDPARVLLAVKSALAPLDVALSAGRVGVRVESEKHMVSIEMDVDGADECRSASVRVHVYWISLSFSTKIGTISVDDIDDLDEAEVVDCVSLYTRIAAAWLTGSKEPWGVDLVPSTGDALLARVDGKVLHLDLTVLESTRRRFDRIARWIGGHAN